MTRFVNGTKAERDKRLSLMLQMGPTTLKKSFTRYIVLKLLSWVMLRLKYGREPPKTEIGPSDRHPYPLVPVSAFSETRHFGGALQDDESLPKNYVSFTAHLTSTRAPIVALSSLIVSCLEKKVLAKTIYDTTFVLAGEQPDEIPERALCSMRHIHVHPNDVALPVSYIRAESHRMVANFENEDAEDSFFDSFIGSLSASVVNHTPRWLGGSPQNISRTNRRSPRDISKHGGEAAHEAAMRELFSGEKKSSKSPERQKDLLKKTQSRKIITHDPIGQATNELISILEEVKIPVRRGQLDYYEFASTSPFARLEMPSNAIGNRLDDCNANELLPYPILNLVTRGDIQRHFIAARCNIKVCTQKLDFTSKLSMRCSYFFSIDVSLFSKKAAVRIVDSAAWRGQTFPIDTRMCRIELQNGQFFHQGKDRLDQVSCFSLLSYL